ncbi:hypothetical protein HN615_10495, partial [Candidatus Woesearchaeota archaeon]|nr:hypothetical protein [Lentimicrobiaceae bacterium]MBT7557340.1 hypothetical protein [Candidatus Woesearchaeota archaeon]
DHPSFYATSGDGAIEKLINYITNTNGFIYLMIIVVGSLISLIFLVVSMFGLYKMLRLPQLGKGGREIVLFSSFVVIYFIAITGPIVGVKYRLPIEPIMTMFFAYAFAYFRRNSER